MNSSKQSTSKLTKVVVTIAVLLVLIAIGMVTLIKTGLPAFDKWRKDAELEKQLKNPANAQHVGSIKADQNELRRLDTFKKDITGNIQKFGTNSPVGKFMQKEMQRLEQNVEMRKTHLEETKRELK